MKSLKTVLLLLIATACRAQFALPELDTLFRAVDRYYSELTAAQQVQLKEDSKGRWLNYLPSPGWSVITGFSVNFNLSAPVQEAKARRQMKAQAESIARQNDIARQQLRNEVHAGWLKLSRQIRAFQGRQKLDATRQKIWAITAAQYDRKEITPTAYLTKLQEREETAQAIEMEAATIQDEILLLLVKAKAGPN